MSGREVVREQSGECESTERAGQPRRRWAKPERASSRDECESMEQTGECDRGWVSGRSRGK